MFLVKTWPTPLPRLLYKYEIRSAPPSPLSKNIFCCTEMYNKEQKIYEEIQIIKFTNSDEHVKAFNQIWQAPWVDFRVLLKRQKMVQIVYSSAS